MYIEKIDTFKARNPQGKWIAAWGTSPVDFYISLADYVKKLTMYNVIPAGATTRTEFTVTANGSKIRLRFSNEYGVAPIRISGMCIARADGRNPGGIIGGTSYRITFDGGNFFTEIPAGGEIVSDEADFPISALERLSVSMLFQEKNVFRTTGLYSAITYMTKNRRSSQINRTVLREPVKLRLYSGTMACNFIPFLCGVDAYCEDENAKCVVMAGDSTFCNDAFIHLEERILSTGCTNISVVNKAISGNRLLCGGAGLIGNFYGASLLDRFKRDVIDQAGVEAVIVKIGINDITHPFIVSMKGTAPYSSIDEIIDGFKRLAAMAHENNIRIYLSKIAPWNGYDREILGKKGDLRWSEELYSACSRVNDWIEKSEDIDGFVDTDELADPNDVTRLYKPFTTDGMHFSPLGAIAFSDIVPMEFVGIDKGADTLLNNKYRYFPTEMNQSTEESGDFGEHVHQIGNFALQMLDHMRLKMK